MSNRYGFLKGAYFFKDLSDEEIRKMERVCHEISYKGGEIIFEEGSKADRFYIISEGLVEVWKDFNIEERDLLAVHGQGHLFGEMALIDELPRSATVVAKEKCRLLYINREDFQKIVMENSGIALSIMISVSSMIRRSNESFVDHLRERNRELEESNEALKKAQDELLRKDRLSTLGKFSSLILHDIRNPLSVLRGLAEMILLHGDVKEKVERNAKRIIRELDRLNRLVSELLDYSRGEIRLNMAILDADRFIQQVIEEIDEKFSARNIEIRTEIDCDTPLIFDSQRMFRVFINLSDNAWKAMPQGGTFWMRMAKKQKTLEIEISDTGVGMHPDIQQKIFEPFFSHSNQGGTGLGMPIVKSVIEAHHGTILLASEEGGGTSFRITLPLIV